MGIFNLKSILIIGLLLLMSACKREVPVKPFIITKKGPSAAYPELFLYEYFSKNGMRENFYDSAYKYNIGDTIK